MRPIDVGTSSWEFPDPASADRHGLVGVGADLEPATLIHAYRHGMFPMPADEDGLIAWWSPDPRGILDLDRLHVSRSLRRSCRRHRVTIDRAFDEVIETCSSLPRPGGWISPPVIAAYERLHRMGWAHSAECWDGDRLVGGIYGVQIGAFFAGESMFHHQTDASKVALVGLVTGLRRCRITLFDVQWQTDHLATLGVETITRSDYLARLAAASVASADSLGVLSIEDSVLRPTTNP